MVSPIAWGQFLVENRSTVQPYDALYLYALPKELRSIISLPPAEIPIYTGTAHAAVSVGQGQFAVLWAKDTNFSVLASRGAGPCVMVILRPADNLAFAHSHIDAITSTTTSITTMLNHLRSFSAAPVEAILAGSDGDYDLLKRIVNALRKIGINNIKFYKSSAIAIDNSGAIYFNEIYSDNLMSIKAKGEMQSIRFNSSVQNQRQNREQNTQEKNCDEYCRYNSWGQPLNKLYVSGEK